MLQIAYNSTPGLVSWHVGEKLNTKHATHEVKEIYADGDELSFILQNVEGIPRAKGQRSMRWYGDHARFIVANLLLPFLRTTT